MSIRHRVRNHTSTPRHSAVCVCACVRLCLFVVCANVSFSLKDTVGSTEDGGATAGGHVTRAGGAHTTSSDMLVGLKKKKK